MHWPVKTIVAWPRMGSTGRNTNLQKFRSRVKRLSMLNGMVHLTQYHDSIGYVVTPVCTFAVPVHVCVSYLE